MVSDSVQQRVGSGHPGSRSPTGSQWSIRRTKSTSGRAADAADAVEAGRRARQHLGDAGGREPGGLLLPPAPLPAAGRGRGRGGHAGHVHGRRAGRRSRPRSRTAACSRRRGFLELGNVRPLIPLSVDPPRHLKYRKILDPIFAPKQMDAIEDDVTDRVNHFIDQFIDRGECHFTNEFAEPFPSSVFLGLMGLPWEELDTFLRLEGRHPPARHASTWTREERIQIQHDIGQELYAYFDDDPRRAARRPTRRHPHPVQQRRDRRRAAHPRGDPRHLLPVLHRRPRHRDRLAVVLLRVPRPAPRPPPPARREPGASSRARSRSCCAGRRRCRTCPAWRRRGVPGRRSHRVPEGELRPRQRGRGERRPRRVPRRRWRCASTVRSTATSRSAAGCTGASARTWPAASCGSRCASGTAASPTTASSPASSCTYAPGLRLVENLELVWPAR